VVVEIPRKSDEYYNQYQRILINLITNNVNIFYIKDTQKEPSTYQQVINGPEKEEWNNSMCEELEELENQRTWELVNLPHNRKALKGRWVYKKKINNTNNTIRDSYIK